MPISPKSKIIIASLFSLLGLYFLISPFNSPLYNFLIFPSTDKKVRSLPDGYLGSLPGAQLDELYFNSDGLKLHALFLRNPKSKRVFLLSHGKGNNVYLELDHARMLYQFGSVFMYDYRGFGKSEGTISVEGAKVDALSAYDYLKNAGYEPENIIAFGQSFGTGISGYLSTQRQVNALIFQSGYCSLSSVGKRKMPWLIIYPDWMFGKIDIDNLAFVRAEHPPLLAFHGLRDPEIPVQESIELCKHARPLAKLVVLPEGKHLAYGANGEFHQELSRFLEVIEKH